MPSVGLHCLPHCSVINGVNVRSKWLQQNTKTTVKPFKMIRTTWQHGTRDGKPHSIMRSAQSGKSGTIRESNEASGVRKAHCA